MIGGSDIHRNCVQLVCTDVERFEEVDGFNNNLKQIGLLTGSFTNSKSILLLFCRSFTTHVVCRRERSSQVYTCAHTCIA